MYRGNVIKRKESGSWRQWKVLPYISGVLDQYRRTSDVDSYYRDILLLLRGFCGRVKMNGKYKTVRFFSFLLFVDSLLPHVSG